MQLAILFRVDGNHEHRRWSLVQVRSGSLERVRFSLHCFPSLHLTLDLLIGHLADSEWLSFSKLLGFAGVWFLFCVY